MIVENPNCPTCHGMPMTLRQEVQPNGDLRITATACPECWRISVAQAAALVLMRAAREGA